MEHMRIQGKANRIEFMGGLMAGGNENQKGKVGGGRPGGRE